MCKKFLKSKEIGVIILIALFFVLLSLIIKEELPACSEDFCLPTGDMWEVRGWPFAFIAGVVGPKFSLIPFLFNFIFYFFVAFTGWIIIKKFKNNRL